MRMVILLAALTAGFAPSIAMAKEETRAMASRACKADKLKQVGGSAVVKVAPAPQNTPNVYRITLDTTKMTWQQLTRKLAQAKCL